MKALVLAGGSATRLRPFSHAIAKQLVPIAGKPVLEHVLRDVAATGVTDAAVIVGDTGPQIVKAIGDGSDLGLNIGYIRQEKPLGLAHCVRLARRFLGDDDFVLYLGDNMLRDGIAGLARRFRAARPAAQLLVRRVPDPREFGVAELGEDGAVLGLEEKPARPRGDRAVLGVYFFTAAVHEAVAAIRPSARGELEITDAIQWLIARGAPVRAVEYEGYWRDIGRPEDVLACSRRYLADLRPRVAGDVDAASELTGPVVVEPGARVRGSRIVGPALVGADSLLDGCRVGPHVAVGRGCVLRGARVRDSIVLDGTVRIGGLALDGALLAPVAAHSIPGRAATGRDSRI
ncbi:glucose-1-phosphate thymidylyltransferase [Actinomadura miaoliensis]|uniref:Glucose-1-phosphate thymidylyltransferase n=1 Tax=Actinomadura miaoliensis TaxID=430685 RepID=A0ABP7WP23_9ACTN